MQSHIERIEKAIAELKAGRMIILTDDPSRENEGDLIFPAENITPEIMNFMIRQGTGIVCLSLTKKQINKLQLPLMVAPQENTSLRGTPFTVSFDAKEHITTGVSAHDRATSVLLAVQDDVHPAEIVKPGHIFPLQAHEEGVLARQGHTEGALDIIKLAGFKPAAVICEVMNANGTMAAGKNLREFADQHQLFILTIEDILHYRYTHENLIVEEAQTTIPLEKYGIFNLIAIREKITGNEHIVLIYPNKDLQKPTLVRIHSACTTGDLFASQRCDCHHELHYSLERMSEEGGMLIYLNQEGRGIGLFNKIKAYSLQDTGLDTVEANEKLGLPVDARNYSIAANVLRNHNIDSIRLLTNNPIKIEHLKKFGIAQVQREPIPTFQNEHNHYYLKIKKEKLNHHLNIC